MRGISKRFLGVTALEGVEFEVRAGEVHALMGENGAGKSTLIKVMTGVYTPEEGEIVLGDKSIRPRSPDDAVKEGISTVYQEVNLVPNLSVAENICLGREPRGPLGIKWKALRARAEKALARVGVEIDVRRSLGGCSIAIQQMVAIARALDVSAKVLVLDEPTSSLDANEVTQLFDAIRRLRSEGLGIVFVTHFLDQVYELSDRITILRNGQKVGTWNAAELTRLELVSQMIGRDASALDRTISAASSEVNAAKPFLTAKELGREGSVNGLDFEIKPGQVLGLAGLLGSGRTETVRLLFGLDSADKGTLDLDGVSIRHFGPKRAIKQGFGLCVEDRKAEGIFPELTIRENMMVVMQAKQGWLRKIPSTKQKELATDLTGRLKVQPPDIERQIQFLSGGNQQKALLARWLSVDPRLLLLDEPTRGIDVGAKFEIMSLVERLRLEGKSFVFVSSEIAEVVRSATQVLVLRDRKVVGSLEGNAITEENIVNAIAGEAV